MEGDPLPHAGGGKVGHVADDTVAYSRSWTYDAAGNRLTQVKDSVTTNYTCDSDNRLLTAGNRTFSYDDNGSLASETEDQVTASYTYDYDNHLLSTSDGETFAYDQRGYRVRRTVNGVVTRFLYDGWRVWGEADASGTTQAFYTRGRSGPVSQRRSGVSSYFGFDGLGSAAHLTNASESITETYAYEAFGGSTGTSANPFGFVGALGYYTDAPIRLLLTHRYYRADLGRFMTVDPIGIRGGLNLYGYVRGNPVGRVDPAGLYPGDTGGTPDSGDNNYDGVVDGEDTGETPDPSIPNYWDPVNPGLGDDWVWKGKGDPGSREGNWYNPGTGESLHPDLEHGGRKGPHWDWHCGGTKTPIWPP